MKTHKLTPGKEENGWQQPACNSLATKTGEWVSYAETEQADADFLIERATVIAENRINFADDYFNSQEMNGIN